MDQHVKTNKNLHVNLNLESEDFDDYYSGDETPVSAENKISSKDHLNAPNEIRTKSLDRIKPP